MIYLFKMKKVKNKSEFRKVIDSVKYMTKRMNTNENPLPKIKTNE
tara:strand:+ start:291 stop:425 length:135 start_codon:yes stop_codon:yes gene_type:complete